jgi:hypothetical protein
MQEAASVDSQVDRLSENDPASGSDATGTGTEPASETTETETDNTA